MPRLLWLARSRMSADLSPAKRHLRRLETLIDSVYAVVIVLLVTQLPNPLDAKGEYESIRQFFFEHGEELIGPVVGLVFLISYWMQNNALYGYLVATDRKHASLAIAQLLFVLIYLYSADLHLAFPESRVVLAIQSGTLVLIGAAALWGFNYAVSSGRLLRDGVSQAELRSARMMILPEPLAALFTLPFAALGGTIWNLAWLSLPGAKVAAGRYAEWESKRAASGSSPTGP